MIRETLVAFLSEMDPQVELKQLKMSGVDNPPDRERETFSIPEMLAIWDEKRVFQQARLVTSAFYNKEKPPRRAALSA